MTIQTVLNVTQTALVIDTAGHQLGAREPYLYDDATISAGNFAILQTHVNNGRLRLLTGGVTIPSPSQGASFVSVVIQGQNLIFTDSLGGKSTVTVPSGGGGGSVDLTGYATVTAVQTAVADKVTTSQATTLAQTAAAAAVAPVTAALVDKVSTTDLSTGLAAKVNSSTYTSGINTVTTAAQAASDAAAAALTAANSKVAPTDLVPYAKSADIGATVTTGVATAFAATKPQDVRAAPLASRSTTGIEFISDPAQAAGPIVIGSAIGLTTGSSLYGPVIIRVDDKGLSGKKYRMLLSTDHDPTAGGIWVLEADAVNGPWTNIKTDLTASFTDTVSGKQTETSYPVWEPLSQQWYVYYQQDYGAINGTQKTCLAITSDFVTWERVGPVIDPPVGLFPGTGSGTFHTGYAQVTRRSEGDWIAHHLCGDGNYTRYATSYSRDGVNWITDPIQKTGALSRVGLDDRRCFPTGRIFKLNGELFATSTISSFVSGAASGGPVAVAGRISPDLNSWITTPEVLWRAKYDWEQGGAGSSVFIDTDGSAWLIITNLFRIGFAKANFRVEGVVQ